MKYLLGTEVGTSFAFSLGQLRYRNRKEERMTKFRMIGAAAVLSSVLAGPAMAKQVIAHPVHQAESTYCATIEPGNPYSPVVGIVAAMMLAPRNPMFSGGSAF